MTIVAPDVIEIVTGADDVVTVGVPGRFYADDEVRVWLVQTTDGTTTEAALTLGVDFMLTKTQVQANPVYFTGTISTTQTVAASASIVVMVWPVNEQLTDFSAVPHNPADFELQHDLAALRDQSFFELLKRSPRLPFTYQGDQMIFPDVSNLQDDALLSFIIDANGNRRLSWQSAPDLAAINAVEGLALQVAEDRGLAQQAASAAQSSASGAAGSASSASNSAGQASGSASAAAGSAVAANNSAALADGRADDALDHLNDLRQVTGWAFSGASLRRWVTLAPTGTGSGNVIQSVNFDPVLAEWRILQMSAGTAYFRVLDVTGKPRATDYEVAVPDISGDERTHQGHHWDGTYYWAGGSAARSNRLIRVEESTGNVVEFPINLDLSRASASGYGGNITIGVKAALDLVAIRATDQTTNEDWIFVGSWLALKTNSSTWAATDTPFKISSDQEGAAQPFQGLFPNANFVTVITGDATISDDKRLYTYNRNSGTIFEGRKTYPGLNYASDEGDKLEPEDYFEFTDQTGAQFAVIVFCTGTSGNNINRAYVMMDTKARGHHPLSGPKRRFNDIDGIMRDTVDELHLRKESGVWTVLTGSTFGGVPSIQRDAGWTMGAVSTSELVINPPSGNLKSISNVVVTTDDVLLGDNIMALWKMQGNTSTVNIKFKDMLAARGTFLDPVNALIPDGTDVKVMVHHSELVEEQLLNL